jgi:hypothetical protein
MTWKYFRGLANCTPAGVKRGRVQKETEWGGIQERDEQGELEI